MAPAGLERLPPFPVAASRLLQLLAKEDFEQSELVSIIRVDPMLAAELLRLVNSASFGRVHPVTGIQHAVALLGHDRLRCFATAVSLRLYLGRVIRGEALARVWRHSLATAACGELLAAANPGQGRKQADQAYLAGLLHDVGALGMMVLHPEEYAQVVARAAAGDLRRVEIEHFGYDHCSAGGWIAKRWKLGAEIESAALHHHDPPVGESFATIEVVKAAVLLADALGWSTVAAEGMDPAQAVIALPVHFREGLEVEPDQLCASIAERIEVFSEVGSGSSKNTWRSGTK